MFGPRRIHPTPTSTSTSNNTSSTNTLDIIKTTVTDDTYKPKKSKKISKALQNIPHDNDIWVEGEHVFAKNDRRTYFRSIHTTSLFWDEPPSGASHVLRRGGPLENHPDKRLLHYANEKLMLPHWKDKITKWDPHQSVPNTFANLRDVVG